MRELRELFPSLCRVRPEHAEVLQRSVLERYRAERSSPARTARRWFRPVLVAAATLLAGIGACAAPADYEAPVGKAVEFTLAGEPRLELLPPPAQIERLCRAEGVEFAGAMARLGEARVTFGFLGEDEAVARVVSSLRQHGALAGAAMSERPLSAPVNGSLAGWLLHEHAHVEIDRSALEESRAFIAARLREQGFQDVQVEPVDGGLHIKVRARNKEGVLLPERIGLPAIRVPGPDGEPLPDSLEELIPAPPDGSASPPELP